MDHFIGIPYLRDKEIEDEQPNQKKAIPAYPVPSFLLSQSPGIENSSRDEVPNLELKKN